MSQGAFSFEKVFSQETSLVEYSISQLIATAYNGTLPREVRVGAIERLTSKRLSFLGAQALEKLILEPFQHLMIRGAAAKALFSSRGCESIKQRTADEILLRNDHPELLKTAQEYVSLSS